MTADDHPVDTATTPLREGPVAVLVNPLAGRGRHRGFVPQMLERLRRTDRPVRLLTAGTEEEARQACHAAVAEGAAALLTFGGDGTVHLGLQAVGGTSVAFAPIPAGTGNDFAIETGYPDDPAAALDVIAEALTAGRTRSVDLAHLTNAAGDTLWYGAVLAAGFDSIVNERANRMRWPKGPRRYDVAIMIELARFKRRRYTLRLDGQEQHLDAVLVAVGNCASYGGGMRICHGADPTDGMLDVLVGAVHTRRELIALKPKARYGGHLAHPKVHSYRARTVELDAEGIIGYADGERNAPLPVTVTAVPNALRMLR